MYYNIYIFVCCFSDFALFSYSKISYWRIRVIAIDHMWTSIVHVLVNAERLYLSGMWWGSYLLKNGHPKDTCYDESGLPMCTILINYSIFNSGTRVQEVVWESCVWTLIPFAIILRIRKLEWQSSWFTTSYWTRQLSSRSDGHQILWSWKRPIVGPREGHIGGTSNGVSGQTCWWWVRPGGATCNDFWVPRIWRVLLPNPYASG